MENRIMLYDFHLFDGEGGEGAAASSAESTQDTQRIEYGRSEGEGSAPSQVGSDNSNEADDRIAEWKALTGKGGKFHDLLGQEKSQTIQERFKNQQDLQGRVDAYDEGLSPLYMNYGLRIGDFEGLKEAIAHDDAFFQAQAERAGLDIDQYRENLRLREEAERGRRIEEAYKQQQIQNEMFSQWEAEADELRQAFPAFDLGLEMQNNERFYDFLTKGGATVREAFMAAHGSEILAGSNAHAGKQATQNVLNTIQQRASRPAEGAMHPNPAIVRKSDPSSLSNEDIDEINRRVANGEMVYF